MNFEKGPLPEVPGETPPQEHAAETKVTGNEMLPEVAAAKTFEELRAVVDQLGGMKSGSRYYTADELKEHISRVERTGALIFAEGITRAGGLRKKVTELAKLKQKKES